MLNNKLQVSRFIFKKYKHILSQKIYLKNNIKYTTKIQEFVSLNKISGYQNTE